MRLRKIAGILLISVSVSTLGYVLYTRYSSMAKMDELLNTTTSEPVTIESVTDEFISQDMEVDNSLKGVERIEIPSISVKAPIVDGIGDNLSYSVGHFPDTPNIGEDGNICLAGHSSAIYNCIFNGLADADLGSDIVLYDKADTPYRYTLLSKTVVIPQEMSVLRDKGDNRLTIVTCVESGKRRLIVTAKIVTEVEKEALTKDINSGKYAIIGNQLANFSSTVEDLSFHLTTVSSTRAIKHYFPRQNYNSQIAHRTIKDSFNKIKIRGEEFRYEV